MLQQPTKTNPANSHKETPTLELEAFPQKLVQMMQQEQQLKQQDEGIQAFCQMRETFVSRYQALTDNKHLFGNELQMVEQLWQRLWSEPQDPEEFVNQHYQKSIEQLHAQCLALLKQLQGVMQARNRTLSSWRNLIHEISNRLNLLQKLDDYLKPLEEVITEHQKEKEREREEQKKQMEQPLALSSDSSPTQENLSVASSSLRAHDTVEIECHSFATPSEQPEPLPQQFEARQHPRLELGTIVNFSEDDHSFYTGFSENISEGGLFIATYTFQPKKGDRFSLSFSLPDEPPIEVIGEVTWLREQSSHSSTMTPGFGCKFINLEEGDKYRINQFIHHNEALFMPPACLN